jgi:hypothetical protein
LPRDNTTGALRPAAAAASGAEANATADPLENSSVVAHRFIGIFVRSPGIDAATSAPVDTAEMRIGRPAVFAATCTVAFGTVVFFVHRIQQDERMVCVHVFYAGMPLVIMSAFVAAQHALGDIYNDPR